MDKLLTVRIDLVTLAEFRAAVKILRGRSVSAHLHNYVIQQILEARSKVSEEEFDSLVAEQVKSIQKRSNKKQAERKRRDQATDGVKKRGSSMKRAAIPLLKETSK